MTKKYFLLFVTCLFFSFFANNESKAQINTQEFDLTLSSTDLDGMEMDLDDISLETIEALEKEETPSQLLLKAKILYHLIKKNKLACMLGGYGLFTTTSTIILAILLLKKHSK